LESTIDIERVAFGGAGIGHLPDGRICFVHGTLPGERAIVRVVAKKKTYAEAVVVRMVEVSARRVRPACPVFGLCGGCAYQHAEYPLQLEIKTSQVAEALRKIGGFADVAVSPMIASPLQWGYRNRLSVHIDRGQVGFHGRKSHRIVEVSDCPLASAGVNDQLLALSKNPPRFDGRRTLRCAGGPMAFTQVNDGAAADLLATVREMAEPGGGHLVDAYCGVGFFAKSLRSLFEIVTGIEWSEGAVRAARSGASEGETYCDGPVGQQLAPALGTRPGAETTLLVDPPAEGLTADVTEAIMASRPARMIYVSCDPATLARDLKKLAAAYRIARVQPVDMFPQTAEIETATQLVCL